jgi:hypothetical protein
MYINNLYLQKGYGWQTRYPQPNILNIQLAGIAWSSLLAEPLWNVMDLGQIWGFPYMVAFIIDSTAEKVLYIYIYTGKKRTFALRLHVWMLWYLGGYGSTGTTTKENVINWNRQNGKTETKHNRQQSWGCPKIWEYPKKTIWLIVSKLLVKPISHSTSALKNTSCWSGLQHLVEGTFWCQIPKVGWRDHLQESPKSWRVYSTLW